MANVAKKDETETSLARPSFIEQDARGTEDIGADEIKLPCLKIAQGLTPQNVTGNPLRIEDLQDFDFFNDLTEEVLCRFSEVGKDGFEPVRFIVGRRQVKRIQFDPDDRNIPLNLEVPRNSPLMDWTTDQETGKRVPPQAIKFVEFISLILRPGRMPEPIVISIQETNKWNKKAHERLSGFIKGGGPDGRPCPIYAAVYTLTPGMTSNDKGSFGIYLVGRDGYVTDEDTYNAAKSFSIGLEGKEVKTDRSGEDGTEFDPSSYEREPGDESGM